HRGEDERARAEVLQPLHGGADDRADVGDSAAAGADGDGVAGLDPEGGLAEGGGHGARNVRDAGAGEGLTDADHPGQRHWASSETRDTGPGHGSQRIFRPGNMLYPLPTMARTLLFLVLFMTAGCVASQQQATPLLVSGEHT